MVDKYVRFDMNCSVPGPITTLTRAINFVFRRHIVAFAFAVFFFTK